MTIQTRSQTLLNVEKEYSNLAQTLLKVDIDFDEASKAWKANKKSIGNGCYTYICIKINKSGKSCKNKSLPNCDYCRFHNRL